MGKEYTSFYKTVKGGEGDRCNYPTRLDTYGRGCQHNCSYCYVKSLLDFRKFWDNENPAIADIEKIRKKIKKIPKGSVVRLGGMTDCFQPMEKIHRVTLETIKALNEQGVHYLIVTKSHIVADEEYLEILDKQLAHIQISVTTTDNDLAKTYEKASKPSERIRAIEKLQKLGFDVQLRLSPFIPQYIDFKKLNKIKCDKILIEFLRINPFIRRWFSQLDMSEYTLREGGYYHLPMDKKLEYIGLINGNFKEKTVCEDFSEHYEYWKNNFNNNSQDCCNLRFGG